jgi:hypothetical protein
MPGAPARNLSAVPQSQAGLLDVCVLRHAVRCNEERPQYGHTDLSPLALRHCVHVPRETMLGMIYFFVERFGPNACLVAGTPRSQVEMLQTDAVERDRRRKMA